MGGTSTRAALCILLAALAWAQLAHSQANAGRGTRPASELPDAPSASIPPEPKVVQLARANTAQMQSWWLVAPENAPYRPLSKHEKFMSFVHHTFSPYTLAGAMYDATWSQMWNDPQAYGGGMEGWGKRLGAATASTETRSFFGSFLFPVLLRQDPRYFAMYKGPVKQRALNAVKRVFVTRNDDGREVFNSSGMLTIAFSEALSMAWTPEGQRTAGNTFSSMLGSIQGDATSYLLREFTPDLLRIFKRHAPKSLRRLEEKIPAAITGDMGQP